MVGVWVIFEVFKIHISFFFVWVICEVFKIYILYVNRSSLRHWWFGSEGYFWLKFDDFYFVKWEFSIFPNLIIIKSNFFNILQDKFLYFYINCPCFKLHIYENYEFLYPNWNNLFKLLLVVIGMRGMRIVEKFTNSFISSLPHISYNQNPLFVPCSGLNIKILINKYFKWYLTSNLSTSYIFYLNRDGRIII